MRHASLLAFALAAALAPTRAWAQEVCMTPAEFNDFAARTGNAATAGRLTMRFESRDMNVVPGEKSVLVDFEMLDAAILFAPVGALVPTALRATDRGGTVVCGGIHMSDIPSMPYEILWGERVVRSVANLTRRDGDEFFAIVREMQIDVATQTFDLARAGDALDALRAGRVEGAAVLRVG